MHAAGLAGGSADRIEWAVLAILLALIPLRTLLHETQTHETPANTRRLAAPSGPSPATTLVIDGLIFAAAGVVAANRLRRGEQIGRLPCVEIGTVVVAVAGIVSTAYASNRRTAMTGAIDLAALLTYLLLLRQVIRRPWQTRLALCVILATGAMAAYKCVAQIAWEFPETIRQYEAAIKQQMREGTLSPGTQHDFEQRLKGQAASAFFSHPNVAGTCMAAVSLLALGLAAARRGNTDRLAWIAPLLLAGLATVAMGLTQGKGAAAAWGAGLLLWGVWKIGRGSLCANPRRSLLLFWALAAALVAGTVAFGNARGGLPTRSMLYRWQYWRAAAGMTGVIGWHGVGANNFGTYFTRFKPVECPEDVQDPHSWFVRMTVEWGPLGLLGMLIVWTGVSLRLSRQAAVSVDPARGQVPPGERSLLRWLAVLIFLVAAGYCLVYRAALRVPEHAAFIVTTLLEVLTVWGAAFALLSIESKDVAWFRDEPSPPIRPAIVIAAAAFLLHASVDMALSASAATTLLFAMLATGISSEIPPPRPGAGPRVGAAWATVAATAIALAAFAVLVVWPVYRTGDALETARRAPIGQTRADFQAGGAMTAYQRAIAADPLDRAPLDELLDELLADPPRVETVAHVDEALAWADELRRRDPASARADMRSARLMAIRHALSGNVDDLRAATAFMGRCVAAYPTSPERRLSLGFLLAQLAESTGEGDTARLAVAELKAAIWMDERRVYISRPHRLQESQITEILARIEHLENRPPG